VWEAEFRANADREAWGWTSVPDGEEDLFATALADLSDELKRSRRWG
jgi:hypothetical protein